MTTPTNREAVDWEDLDVKNWSSFSNWETWKLWLTMDELTEHEYLRIFSLCKAIEKQAIRQTHLDLLREVEQEVIGEDGETQKEWSGTGNNFGIRCQNNLKHQQRQKLSHIITRVEGKGLND